KCNQECIKICPVDAIYIEEESAVIDLNKCINCFGCAEVCPVKKAIKSAAFNNFNIFSEILIDNATGVIKSFGAEKIRYFNFAFDIPAQCDCVVNVSMPIIPDLGIFGSPDPLSIDKACIDAETNAPGLPILNAKGEWKPPVEAGIEKFKAMNQSLDPFWQIEAALKNKIGKINYELIKI
ncbi:MAG: 4Fe-4S dicluster domain-containing protein, partial [Promethearchaeota archaeon]